MCEFETYDQKQCAARAQREAQRLKVLWEEHDNILELEEEKREEAREELRKHVRGVQWETAKIHAALGHTAAALSLIREATRIDSDRLGRGPDMADALALHFAPKTQPADELADHIRRYFGVKVDAKHLENFILVHWDTVSKLAHRIHRRSTT